MLKMLRIAKETIPEEAQSLNLYLLQRSNCQHSLDHRESKGIPEKHLPVSLTMLKPLTVWIVTDHGKLSKR